MMKPVTGLLLRGGGDSTTALIDNGLFNLTHVKAVDWASWVHGKEPSDCECIYCYYGRIAHNVRVCGAQ